MLDRLALPFICATKHCSLTQWFVRFREIIDHPLLHEDEKFLWLWLATKCTDKCLSSCSFSYEQISHAVKIPSKRIHRILTRLRTMGVLLCTIPIWYGGLTLDMVSKIHTFTLVMPPKRLLS